MCNLKSEISHQLYFTIFAIFLVHGIVGCTVDHMELPAAKFDQVLSEEEILEKLHELSKRFEQVGLDYLVFDPEKLILKEPCPEMGDLYRDYIASTSTGKLFFSILKHTGELASLRFSPKEKAIKKYKFGNGSDNSIESLLRKINGSIPPGIRLREREPITLFESVNNFSIELLAPKIPNRRPNQKERRTTQYKWERTHLGYPCLYIPSRLSEISLGIDTSNRIRSFYKEWRSLPDTAKVNIGFIRANIAAWAVKRELVKRRMARQPSWNIYIPISIKLGFVSPTSRYFDQKETFLAFFPNTNRRLAWKFRLMRSGQIPADLIICIDAETGECLGGSIIGL